MLQHYLITITALFFFVVSCSKPQSKKPLIIGTINRSSNALLCLADKHNSKKNIHKKWKLKFYDRGDQTLDDLSKNQIDIAISAPPSFFRTSIESPEKTRSLKIVAGINSIHNTFSMLTKRDSNIKSAKDLVGKRLGHQGEYTEFYKTYLFLTEGINESTISEYYFKNSQLALKALEENKIDAALVPDEINKKIDRKKYVPHISTVQEITSQIIVKTSTLNNRHDDVVSLVSDLIQAENDLYQNPKDALKKLQLCYPDSHDEILNDLIARRSLRVLIDESLISQYIVYKKWLISQPEYRSKVSRMRDFKIQDYLFTEILHSIDFRRVLIK